MIGGRLDWVILEVFSNLGDSMILWFYDEVFTYIDFFLTVFAGREELQSTMIKAAEQKAGVQFQPLQNQIELQPLSASCINPTLCK